MAQDLVSRYGSDSSVTNWVDSNQIFLVTPVNPDGYEVNLEDLDSMWRKNTHRFNHKGRWDPDSDGVDLNRNYDFLWHEGDSDLGNRYYRGTAPFSEKETQAIRDLALRERFMFDVCYHSDSVSSDGEETYYPWIWGSSESPDYAELKKVCDSMCRHIKTDDGKHTYASLYGNANEGAMARNWLYYGLGTFAYTMEVSHGYQPPGYMVDSICPRVSRGVYYLLDRAHGPGITGHVTDSATGLPLAAQVTVLEATSTPDTIQPRYSDSLFGRYWHLLSPDTYSIEVSKWGYYTRTLRGVTVAPGRTTVLDIALTRNPGIEEQRVAAAPSFGLRVKTPADGRRVEVRYQIEREGRARLDVYDLSGRLRCELADGELQPGSYSAVWDAQGAAGGQGVYFVRLACGSQSTTSKVVVER
jgi:hypothetical protein